MTASPLRPAEPDADCALCPRLQAYRHANRAAQPAWFNAPVPSWGALDARLLVVGMAPGVRGANRTGRPFTGDHAGILLYETLLKFGWAQGNYGADPADGMTLHDCRIVNAVRCVPPANLPTPAETRTCNGFLAGEIAAMPQLRAILTLGTLAHGALLAATGRRKSAIPFRHGQLAALPPGSKTPTLADGAVLADSYHVSRYNTNTGRLTQAMFEAVARDLLAQVGAPRPEITEHR